MSYSEFIGSKTQLGDKSGFEPVWMPDFLFDFQRSLVEWSLEKGRAAKFADCGMGKGPMALVWAENVVRKTNGRVLILTPLAVSGQMAREGAKFGIEAMVSRGGALESKIVVTNYERLHYFKASDFSGVVCDESSILKNFDGSTKAAITEFMRLIPYRLLCTATAAPNDYIELGTSAEALGEMGYMDMLGMFFKANNGSLHPMYHSRAIRGDKFRFRGHAERDFWKWVCSWARAMRKPSDIGFDDGRFILPPLQLNEHVISARVKNPEWLFSMPAHGLEEQREERRRTLPERCEFAAQLINATDKPAIAWCHLNDEGDLMEKLIPGSVQVTGSDSDEKKEEAFLAFERGDIRVMVSKPVIAGFGLNWQHCSHQTFFPSHSFEQWYQAIRRSWRFGQTNSVRVDMIASEGESGVLSNLRRKADAADKMFSQLSELMNNPAHIKKFNPFKSTEEVPIWLA